MNPRVVLTWVSVLALIVLSVYLLTNPPQPRPSTPPVVVKPANVTPPPPQQQQQTAPLPLCNDVLLKVSNNFAVCGALQYDGKAVMVQRGWIQGRFSASGLEVCKIWSGVNVVYLNCTAPVLVWPS